AQRRADRAWLRGNAAASHAARVRRTLGAVPHARRVLPVARGRCGEPAEGWHETGQALPVVSGSEDAVFPPAYVNALAVMSRGKPSRSSRRIALRSVAGPGRSR